MQKNRCLVEMVWWRTCNVCFEYPHFLANPRIVLFRDGAQNMDLLLDAYGFWRVNTLVVLLLIGVSTAFSQDAGRERRHDRNVAERTAVIHAVVQKVNAYYVYPDV